MVSTSKAFKSTCFIEQGTDQYSTVSHMCCESQNNHAQEGPTALSDIWRLVGQLWNKSV